MYVVNRNELFWALDAVLPHLGSSARQLDAVAFGVAFDQLHVAATDSWTAAIATCPVTGAESDSQTAERPSWHLGAKEATELMRALRPKNKAEQLEEVRLLVQEDELHVAVGDEQGEVYDLTSRTWSWVAVNDIVADLQHHRDQSAPLRYDPDLIARFRKAKKNDGDRILIEPVSDDERRPGWLAAVITVGERFSGCIAGMDEKVSEAA